jgi:misacylated tRNA(Ala) deacylase
MPRHTALRSTGPPSPTGGGQPNDSGALVFAGRSAEVVDVAKDKAGIAWHTLSEESPLPVVGADVQGIVDWRRRLPDMRLHTA